MMVTILILIDGFLQCDRMKAVEILQEGHNPYFNRWFSAMLGVPMNRESITVTILILIDGFLQFVKALVKELCAESHNPYFSRWFSAI